MTAPKPRGGARKGAGRKTADGTSGMHKRSVSLDDATIGGLTALGEGELSLGIRRAWALIVAVDRDALDVALAKTGVEGSTVDHLLYSHPRSTASSSPA